MKLIKFNSTVVLVLTGLIGCVSARSQSVIPPELVGTKSVPLGRMIQSLMPNSTDTVTSWDRQADAAIQWESGAYRTVVTTDHGTIYLRTGIVRINNQGYVAKVLIPKRAELGWVVNYYSKSDPSKGVERISIAPGTREEVCFGPRFDGCDTVAPLQSLRRSGVTAKMLCRERDGPDEVIAYMLHSTGKRPTLMAWWTSGGSGGSNSHIDLELSKLADPKYCIDWFKD